MKEFTHFFLILRYYIFSKRQANTLSTNRRVQDGKQDETTINKNLNIY